MATRAGLLRNRLNERTLLSWAQTNESLRTADSSSPVIAVMQAAHAPLANHCTLFPRACPTSRRLLIQPEVGSVVVIIGNVLEEESLQMALIQRDHVVEQEKPGRGIVGKSFSQLLHDPGAGGMPRDIEVQDAAAIMTDDEEAVQHLSLIHISEPTRR